MNIFLILNYIEIKKNHRIWKKEKKQEKFSLQANHPI